MNSKWICAGFALFFSLSASAAEVSGLNTFSAGSPARASEVNANFDAVKTAVDDNHARLAALEDAGAVSVSVFGFVEFFNNLNENSGCQFNRLLGYAFFQNTSAGCIAAANLALPDGVILGSLSCLIEDVESGTGDPIMSTMSLRRQDLQTGAVDTISTSTGPSENVGLQTLIADIPLANAEVDNSLYSYAVTLHFTTADMASGSEPARFYGCTVSYTR